MSLARESCFSQDLLFDVFPCSSVISPVTFSTPSDRELLRSVYRRLDLTGLLADHPQVSRGDIEKLFRRLAALLPRETNRPAAVAREEAPSGREHPVRKVVLHVDGGSRGNPGPAGCGAVLLDTAGRVLAEESRFIGRATSNEAEYHALLLGLHAARRRGASEVTVRADSQLLVRQLNGAYRVKSPRLTPLFQAARKTLQAFDAWRAEHVPREMNARADSLANKALDRGAG